MSHSHFFYEKALSLKYTGIACSAVCCKLSTVFSWIRFGFLDSTPKSKQSTENHFFLSSPKPTTGSIINELFIEDKFQLCVSEDLLAEYYEVLSRPKFANYKDFLIRAEALLVDIETKATRFVPTIKLDLISDIDDNMILELADECLADFVITGNTTEFRFPTYKQTKIVTPKEYWESHQPNY